MSTGCVPHWRQLQAAESTFIFQGESSFRRDSAPSFLPVLEIGGKEKGGAETANQDELFASCARDKDKTELKASREGERRRLAKEEDRSRGIFFGRLRRSVIPGFPPLFSSRFARIRLLVDRTFFSRMSPETSGITDAYCLLRRPLPASFWLAVYLHATRKLKKLVF